MKRVGVGKIVGILYYNPLRRVPEEVLAEGTMIHVRLGFSGTTTYRRFLELEGELYEIIGMPDKITEDDGIGYVEELKVCSNPRRINEALEIGKTQANIYCWLSGLKNYMVHVYSPRTGMVEKSYQGKYDEEKCLRDIRKGLKRIKKIEEMYSPSIEPETAVKNLEITEFLKA